METKPKDKDCCSVSNKKDKKGFLAGLLYGLIPHSGCIAFILFSVLGVTAASAFFKKLLLNAYFFYILIALSLVFATISALIYLKRCDLLSFPGLKKKWKYLTILYGTTILVNILMFTVVFPYTANLTPTGLVTSSGNAQLTLEVAIPCSGHASLITDELKKLEGISSIKFELPNHFDVSYDSSKLTKEKILALEVFKTYTAKVLSESALESNNQLAADSTSKKGSCCGGSGGCGGAGSCGGFCGSCSGSGSCSAK